MVRSFSTSATDGQSGDDLRVLDASESSEIVIDADFLFSADFVEHGDDLLLRGPDGEEILLRGYFAQDPPPSLETAEGARLLSETVDALAVPEVVLGYAQAGGPQPAQAIGEVREIDGIARVQRSDGTRENLSEGDPIFQGDVVSTGVGSELGIVFVDDTVFSLSAGSRMVIDELIYNPASSANSMGISLIQGTFVFVTGKVAPSGGIDVETPVGTIGIRGTTVGVQIATFGGATRITNLLNPETGELGSFTFSNGAGSALLSLANHFLDVRSASANPGTPSVVSGQSVVESFGRALNRAIEIQRNLSEIRRNDDSSEESLLDQESPLEAEQLQALDEAGLTPEQIQALLSEPPIETAAGPPEDQPLGEGSSFAAGLNPDGLGDDSGAGGDGGIGTTSGPLSPSDAALDNFISTPDGNDNTEEILLFGNSPPEVTSSDVAAEEGELVAIGPETLSAVDDETSDPSLLIYTVTAVSNGLVVLAVGVPPPVVFSFTQADLDNGLVFFAHDGSEDPQASFTVTVTDSDGNVSAPETVLITLDPLNDPPQLVESNLNLQGGDTVVLSSENLSATDAETPDEDLVFTVSEVIGGEFQLLGEESFGSASVVQQQVAVTSFTQQQIFDGQVVFVHDGGAAPPSFFVSVSDGEAETTPVAAEVTFAGTPTVDLALQADVDCLAEDSSIEAATNVDNLAASAEGDDEITEIEISGLQSDWTYDFGGLLVDGAVLTDGDASDGSITVSVPNLASYAGSFALAPPADSDVDHPTITATAMVVDPADSNVTATGAATLDVPVDAVADGPSVSISVNDGDDADAAFAPFETGRVSVEANFGDADDGSESHSVVVEIPEGFIVGLLTGLPDGVTAEVESDGNVVFTVAAGTAGFDYTFDVTAPEAVSDGESFVFTAEARVEETPSDEECETEDNLATAEASAEAFGGVAGVPTVDLAVQTEDGCIKEDTPTQLLVSAETTTPGDSLTTVVVAAPAGWTLTAAVGGQIAGISGDDTDTLSLTLVAGLDSFSGSVTATPPEDSDLDAGFTVTATAVDGSDTAVGEGGFDVPVDAVADGGASVTSGGIEASVDGSIVDLGLSLAPRGGNPGNPVGDAVNGGGFDDDGSEAVTTVAVTLSGDPAINGESDASLLFSPDFGGTVDHSEGSLVWTFSGSEAALQDLVTTLQVDPGDGYVGTLTAGVVVTTEEIAVEDIECDADDNAVTETFAFDVEVVESLLGEVVINEVGLGASEAQAAEFDSGFFSVDAGLSFIEIRNGGDAETTLDGEAVGQLDIEIVGPEGTKVTLDLSTLSGAPEDHGLASGESLVLYEDGTWAIYDAAGAVRDGDSFGTFSANAPWGVGDSTSDALAVNLIQEVVPDSFVPIDALLANDVDTSSLSQPEDEIWTGAGAGSQAADGLLGGFVNNQQFNGQLGDQWAVLGSILAAGQRVLSDPESLNQPVNDGVDDVTRIFARVYADAVPGQTAIPGDGEIVNDSDQAQDWTTSNQSSQGAVNQAAEDFNPQDALDDLDPAQGAGSNDSIAGQTVIDVSEGGMDDAGNGNEAADDVLEGGRGQDFLFGDGDNNLLSGGDHNDLLFGDQGDDRLEGERGADLLIDVDGRDTLVGGEGDDILIGGVERLNEGFAVSDGAGDFLVGDSVVGQAFPEGNIVSLLNDSALGGDVPSINIVYMVDTSGSMRRGLDGQNDPPEGESRLDFAVQALLTVNQLLIDAGLAEFVNLKVIPFDNGPDVETVESESAEFDRADDAGLQPFLDGLRAVGFTNYEIALEVATNWLREDLDPGDSVSERHEEGQNFILFFSEGGDTYEPSQTLFENLYDNGSGSPNISDLTIEAFGFGVPDDDAEALNALGKVQTGADGNGDQVSVVNSPEDFGTLFTGDPDLGEDVILAGSGGDFIFGDTLIVDPEFDGSETDFVARLFSEDDGSFLRLSLELAGRADWIEGGAGNDSIMGQGGEDTIFGEAGSDVIFGGAGDDLLDGGEGGDLLSGGAGVDIFVLRAADAAATLAEADVVDDFEVGVDSLGLADGLESGDLLITDSADGAVITLQASGAFVALLSGVSAADIGPTDFTPVV